MKNKIVATDGKVFYDYQLCKQYNMELRAKQIMIEVNKEIINTYAERRSRKGCKNKVKENV